MSSKMKRIKLPPLTKEEKKALKEFAEARIEDHLDADDEKAANRWRLISEHIREGYLTKKEIDEVIEDLYLLIDEVYCEIDSIDEACLHYSIIKKLEKLV